MPHYFDEEQTSNFAPTLLTAKLQDITFEYYTASGIFSVKRLDKGTEVLLKYCELPTKGSVLDLGCGAGVVGLATKLRNPELEVTLSDVNERALDLARMSAKKLGVKVRVKKSDLFTKLESFDCILVNPPYVAGRTFIFSLIEGAKEHLNAGGTMQLVARHQKGGKILEQKMQEVFGEENVTVLGKGAGFRVYCATKK